MCSIGGWITDHPLDSWCASNLTRALLYYGTPRGNQSAGVALASSNGDSLVVLKRAIAPNDFINLKEFNKLDFSKRQACLIHTRQPTCGGRGDDQAQPFQAGDILSIHNGWYTNTKELKSLHGIDKPSGVDSELVATYVAAHGVKALPGFFESADGSGAVAVMSGGKDIFLARSGNPIEYLNLILGEDKHITIFASTEAQLMAAARYVWLLTLNLRSVTLPLETVFQLVPGKTPTEVVQWDHPRRKYKYSSPSPNYSSRSGGTMPPGWEKDGQGVWRYVGHSGPTPEPTPNGDISTIIQPPAPPSLPTTPGAQAADLDDLIQRATAGQDLTNAEQHRLGYYLLSED